jgi:iron(III) transport system ATP-binding protein
MPGVRLEAVSKRFGAVNAVEDVSLNIEHGAFVTLLGRSGCGKTTTLRMIAGLERNDRGRILIGERLVSSPESGVFLPPERREIGMVFQSYAIWPHMTVFENVAYPLQVRKRPRAEIVSRVEATLKLLEMEGLSQRPATALSGGQQQRVAIARSLVFEPAVLLMDEPLSNLDAKLREQMRVELRALQRRLAITTIYVTHDQDEAMALADRVVVMHQGRVLQVAPPEGIYRRPANRTVADFFGMPNLLAAKIREVRREADWICAHVEGNGWQGWSMAPPEAHAGDSVTVMVRPEAIAISATPPVSPVGIVWRGRLTQSLFRGSRRLAEIDAGTVVLHVEAPADASYATGDEVYLQASTSQTWVLRE